MHSRERGAAHINIFFFLVMLVLFIGALGFGYVQLTDNVDLQTRITAVTAANDQMKADRLMFDHYLEDLLKVAGEGGAYAGRDGHNYDPQPNPLENVSAPKKIRDVMIAFAREANIPESNAKTISSVLSLAKAALDNKDTRIGDLQTQNTGLSVQLTQVKANVVEANSQKDNEVATLTQEKSELRGYIDIEYNKLNARIRGLNAEVRRRDEVLDTEKRDRQAEVLGLNKDKNLLKARIDAQKQLTALVNPPMQPDGAVISSSQAAGRAWIDLGRKDMLPRGTVFRIVAPEGGGLKARGRVSKVEYDRAEITLFDVADPFNPVVKGDLVSNDLYSAKLRRNIYLMGRFSYPLDKPTVKLILEQLGNKVHDTIGPGIDLVLVGGDTLNEERDGFVPITDSDTYKKALFLGIEIATLNKVRDFLQLSTE